MKDQKLKKKKLKIISITPSDEVRRTGRGSGRGSTSSTFLDEAQPRPQSTTTFKVRTKTPNPKTRATKHSKRIKTILPVITVSAPVQEKKNPVVSSVSNTKGKTFSISRFLPGKSFGTVITLSLILMIASTPLLLAFEAHVINVTATLIQIDPPVITPPGGEYNEPLFINIDDSDPDATHIFYTVTPGTDPSLAPDPVCGGPTGGVKPEGPIEIPDDRVVKAIACDSGDGSAHRSIITTEIYNETFILTPTGSIGGRIEGHKYNDLDKSGTFTTGDIGISGWQITLMQGTTTVGIIMTDETGYYAFAGLDPATYDVIEEDRSGWDHVTGSNISTTISGGNTDVIDFFNFDTGFSCLPVPISFTNKLALQSAGTETNDDISVAANVVINGDVLSNDEIEAIGGGATRTINGNASSTNAIATGNFVITESTATGTPVAPLPDAGITIWKAKAAEGGTVNGSFVFPNNTAGLVMGPTEITGDLTFGSSNSVLIKGPIYVHGNLSIGSNSTINQDAGFGNQFTTIIVDGTITIDSNITFNGAGTIGTFLLISTHAAVAGTGAAIETNSNNSDLGDVVLYASNGDVHINSNRTLLAVFATHGTGDDSDDNGAIRLDSNVTINYRTLPSTISCGPRQPFESTSHVLINEFMPNPSGSEAGVAGGALDGEWVELFNPTSATIDLAGFFLYDSLDTHELAITSANTDTGDTLIPSQGYLVVYSEGDGDFALNNTGGDSVRLFSGLVSSGGVLIDSHTYANNADTNKSFARVPDGSSNWVDPDATPGAPNDFFFVPTDPDEPDFVPANKPMLFIAASTSEVLTEENIVNNADIMHPTNDTETIHTEDSVFETSTSTPLVEVEETATSSLPPAGQATSTESVNETATSTPETSDTSIAPLEPTATSSLPLTEQATSTENSDDTSTALEGTATTTNSLPPTGQTTSTDTVTPPPPAEEPTPEPDPATVPESESIPPPEEITPPPPAEPVVPTPPPDNGGTADTTNT